MSESFDPYQNAEQRDLEWFERQLSEEHQTHSLLLHLEEGQATYLESVLWGQNLLGTSLEGQIPERITRDADDLFLRFRTLSNALHTTANSKTFVDDVSGLIEYLDRQQCRALGSRLLNPEDALAPASHSDTKVAIEQNIKHLYRTNPVEASTVVFGGFTRSNVRQFLAQSMSE